MSTLSNETKELFSKIRNNLFEIEEIAKNHNNEDLLNCLNEIHANLNKARAIAFSSSIPKEV